MNILILGGRAEAKDANSICINNMVHEFLSRGHKVWTVVSGNENSNCKMLLNGCWQIQVKRSRFFDLSDKLKANYNLINKLLLALLTIIRHILLMPFYPNVAPFTAYKMARLAEKLVRDNIIDCVIGTYGSYECIKTAIHIKKHCNISVVLYYLDLCTASDNKSAIIRRYAEYSTFKALVRHSKVVDLILIPLSGFKTINKLKNLNKDVIKYVGFPVYLPNSEEHNCCPLPFDKQRIAIVYIGSLSLQNRNPEYIIHLLEVINNDYGVKLSVHFWGLITDNRILSMIEASPIAEYHGFIENKYTGYIMKNSDYILNIGNATSVDMLPSKIFSIFSTGKPVINVVNNTNDLSASYFERYGNSIDIKGYAQDEKSDVANLVNSFLKGHISHYAIKEGLFKEYTPSYICDVILETK